MLVEDIESFISPIQREHFLRDYWSRRFLYLPGNSAKFSALFTWRDLNAALEQHRLEAPRLRLERSGVRIEEASYTILRPARRGPPIPRIDIPKLYAELRQGATLVLDSVDELSPAVGRLCESLTRTFKTHVQVNAYATCGDTPGFGLHWDDHDVLVAQVEGQKHWKLYPTTRTFPLYRDSEENNDKPSTPIWEETITTGNVLYIPRGQWHEATGVGAPTLHLTFGLTNPTGITILSWLVDNLRADELLRQDAPILGSSEQKVAYAAKIRSSLIEAIDGKIIDKYVESLSASMSARPHLSFPYGIETAAPSITLSSNVRFCGSTFANICTDNNSFSFDALGRSWVLHRNLLPVFESLLAGRSLSISEIYKMVVQPQPAGKIDTAIGRLVGEGLLCIDQTDLP